MSYTISRLIMQTFYYFKERSPRVSKGVKEVNESSVNKEPTAEAPVASPNKFFTSRESRPSAGTPALRTYGKPSRPPAGSPGNTNATKKRSKCFCSVLHLSPCTDF